MVDLSGVGYDSYRWKVFWQFILTIGLGFDSFIDEGENLILGTKDGEKKIDLYIVFEHFYFERFILWKQVGDKWEKSGLATINTPMAISYNAYTQQYSIFDTEFLKGNLREGIKSGSLKVREENGLKFIDADIVDWSADAPYGKNKIYNDEGRLVYFRSAFMKDRINY